METGEMGETGEKILGEEQVTPQFVEGMLIQARGCAQQILWERKRRQSEGGYGFKGDLPVWEDARDLAGLTLARVLSDTEAASVYVQNQNRYPIPVAVQGMSDCDVWVRLIPGDPGEVGEMTAEVFYRGRGGQPERGEKSEAGMKMVEGRDGGLKPDINMGNSGLGAGHGVGWRRVFDAAIDAVAGQIGVAVG